MGNKVSLEDHLVNLRLASKQMVRASKKAEGSEKEAKNKLKKAIEARNTEGARIYAQVRGPPKRDRMLGMGVATVPPAQAGGRRVAPRGSLEWMPPRGA